MTGIDCPGPRELLFVPLGGTGEIGMNLNLYGHDGRWLMVDLGITFGNDTTPGIDVIMPDPRFIVERRADLVGLVLTHAHEDHIGAVPYLWPRLRCPIYATPFTASLVRRKLAEAGLLDEAEIVEVPLAGRFSVPPFEIELITLTHSIPEPNALVLRTKAGTVLHTGDWKLDPEPLIGAVSDEAALNALGAEGVLAMVCDSTNALVAGSSGSEAEVREHLTELIGRYEERVAVACFASNVARLETIAQAGLAHDRAVALVGRSLWRIDQAARENGYLTHLPPFVREHDVGYLPRSRALMIVTGSQGEPRSALARIARGEHPHVTLDPGDAVIFSSRIIPGNDQAIGRLQNDLARLGIAVVGERDAFVHVSGHPARDELTRMYQMVRPQVAIPVHGEHRHLEAHARLAESCQVPTAIVAQNGAAIRLAPGPAAIVSDVPVGRLVLDGTALVPLDGGALRERHRMIWNGAAVATVVVDAKGGLLGDPQVTLQGLVGAEEADGVGGLLDEARTAIAASLAALPARVRHDDGAIREAARIALRRTVHKIRGKKPLTEIHLVRL